MIIGFDKARSPSETQTTDRGVVTRVRRAARRMILPLAIAAGLLLFAVVFFAPTIFVTIQSGQVGIRYLRFWGGTQTDQVLTEGMRVVLPWDKVFIYSIRIQEAKHTITVLTKEGLQVKLYVSIRYHPEPDMVGMLQQQIGPDYRDRVVIPEVESALRTIMGRFEMNDVYGSGRGLIQKVINESLESVSQEFVKVDEIVIRQIELPADLQKAIEEKMKQKELVESYEYKVEQAKREALRREIEANGIKHYNDVLNSSLTPNVLRWRGIEATEHLAESPNSKIVFVGPKGSDLPVILGAEK